MTSGPQQLVRALSPRQKDETISALQLTRTLSALPFYNELPLCPVCGLEAPPMALIGGSLWNECKVCAKGVCGNDTTEAWAMLGHACGVCMAVLCVACNQELEVQKKIGEVEAESRADIIGDHELLETRLATANQELSMATAELTAEEAFHSQGRTKAVAEAASLKADIARLRASSTKERAQLGKSLAEFKSELELRHTEFLESQDNVCKSTCEFTELELAEANAEARVARRIACGELVDAADIKLQLQQERSCAASEAEAALSLQSSHRQKDGTARKRVLQLRSDLIEARNNDVFYVTKDRCAIADAKAQLDSMRNPIFAEPKRPVAIRSEPVQATEPAPAPRGLLKFWGQVKEKAKEVKNIAKEVKREVAQALDELDPPPTQSQRASSSSAPSRPNTSATPSRSSSSIVPDDVIQLRAELRRALSACQERTSQQMMHLNEAHERLGSISDEATSLRNEVQGLQSEHRRESARRGQFRAELAVRRKETKSKNMALYAQLSEAFNLFYHRSLDVISALPRGIQDEQALIATKAHLISISSAMLDDCESAIGWRCC